MKISQKYEVLVAHGKYKRPTSSKDHLFEMKKIKIKKNLMIKI